MKKIGMIIILVGVMLCGCAGNIKEGRTLLEEAKYEEAKVIFEKEIQEEKHLDEAHYGKGIACFELKEYEEAVENFEKAVLFGVEKDAVFYSFLGASYMETGRYEDAIRQYKDALALEDDGTELVQETRYNLIVAYEKNGDWDAAKKELKSYVKDYPEDTRIKRDAEFLETR